jgi:hypothetical protein
MQHELLSDRKHPTATATRRLDPTCGSTVEEKHLGSPDIGLNPEELTAAQERKAKRDAERTAQSMLGDALP